SLGFSEDLLKPYVEALGGAWESTTVSDVHGSLDSDMYAALWAVKTEEGVDITHIARGQLRASLRGLAHAVGLPPPLLGDMPAVVSQGPLQAPQAAAAAPAQQPEVHEMSSVIDQGSKVKFTMLPAPKLKELNANYARETGRPPRDYEDTTDVQPSALAARLAAGEAPRVDFSVFGPFGKRIQRLINFQADVWVSGQLVKKKLAGPMNLIRDLAEGLASLPRGGYQAPTFEERWEQVRTKIEDLVEKGKFQGDFDRERPWEAVFSYTAYDSGQDSQWWKIHLELPCLTGRTGGRSRTSEVEGGPSAVDQIERQSDKRAADHHGDDSERPTGAGSKRAKKAKSHWQQVRDNNAAGETKDGRFTKHQGVELCFNWNRNAHTYLDKDGLFQAGYLNKHCPNKASGPAGRAGGAAGGPAGAARRADDAARAHALPGRRGLARAWGSHLGALAKLQRRLGELRARRGQRAQRGDAPAAARPTPPALAQPAGYPGQDMWDRRRVRPRRPPGVPEGPSAREERSAQDALCTAGLRNPHRVVKAWGDLQEVMAAARAAPLRARAREPALVGMVGACGDRPSRAPPPESAVASARDEVAAALGSGRAQAEEHHPSSPLRHEIFAECARRSKDPDVHVPIWLREGAPMGVRRAIAPGGHFPLAAAEATLAVDAFRREFCFSGNHRSFVDDVGENEAPTPPLVREYLEKGFGRAFPSREAAEEVFGATYPAPLGNVRKRKQGGDGWKNRIIQDLKASRVNLLSSTPERAVLPRGIDHAVVMATLFTADGADHGEIFVIDFSDAFMSCPLHESDRPHNCAEVRGLEAENDYTFIVWAVLGFGGKASPLVWARVASAAARTAQALTLSGGLRLQLYVDDPALAVQGPPRACEQDFDLALLRWLVLGLRIAWKKGRHAHGPLRGGPCPALEHEWIGIRFAMAEDCAVMGLTQNFVDELLELLRHFMSKKGHAPIKQARSLVGKAARVAQIIPAATPFAAALWAALTGALRQANAGKRESPPNTVPLQRFFTAARWFRALLEPVDEARRPECSFPLERRVYPRPDAVQWPRSRYHVEFDACPWGGGAALFEGATPVEWFAISWDQEVLDVFGAVLGLAKYQSLWEFITLLLALIIWRCHAEHAVLYVLGDNVAALQDAMQLKGSGDMLVVAREIAWRAARWPLHFECAHLPKEFNLVADSLSRLAAVPPAAFPARRGGPGFQSETCATPVSAACSWTPSGGLGRAAPGHEGGAVARLLGQRQCKAGRLRAIAHGAPRAPWAHSSRGGIWQPAWLDANGVRHQYRRGCLADLTSAQAQARALEQFDAEVLATTTANSEASRRRTLKAIFEQWGVEMIPLTRQKIRRLGASLKAGGYRSAALYLSLAKKMHVQADLDFPPALGQALAEARRSCERGLGPDRKVEGIAMESLAQLLTDVTPLVAGGPANPRLALLAGAWWLTREIELSAAPAHMVTFHAGTDGRLAATWLLPASKTDARALGVARTHGCCCGAGVFGNACPAHALWAQRSWLRARFPSRHSAGGLPALDLALFPDPEGKVCEKDAVVATIRAAAEALGLPAVSADGLYLWGGHSLRVSGAQSLARAGLDIWLIQLLGRWGSDAVLGYIRAAPLAVSTTWALRASCGASPGASVSLSLDEVAGQLAATSTGRRARREGATGPATASRLDDLLERVRCLESSAGEGSQERATIRLDVAEIKRHLDWESLRLRAISEESCQGAPASPSAGLDEDVALVRNEASGAYHAVLVFDAGRARQCCAVVRAPAALVRMGPVLADRARRVSVAAGAPSVRPQGNRTSSAPFSRSDGGHAGGGSSTGGHPPMPVEDPGPRGGPERPSQHDAARGPRAADGGGDPPGSAARTPPGLAAAGRGQPPRLLQARTPRKRRRVDDDDSDAVEDAAGPGLGR
ncbi:unnamed protein product, partial [Prorocentrum cordatum]